MRTSTRAAWRAVISRVAAIPSSSGMRMSISTTSGSEPADAVDRLVAVRRLADDLEVGMVLQHEPEARRARATGRRRSGRGCSCALPAAAGRGPRTRRPGGGRRRACRRRARRARACRSARGRRARCVRPGAARSAAVVADLELDGALLVAHDDPGARGAACFDAFASASWTIRNAARSTPARACAGSPSTRSSTGRPPSRARCASASTRASPGGGRRPRSAGSGEPAAARRSRRAPTASISSAHSAARAGSRSTHAVRAGGLDRDHADVVRDRVVQLARDAHPLGGRPRRVRRARGRARSAPPARAPRA